MKHVILRLAAVAAISVTFSCQRISQRIELRKALLDAGDNRTELQNVLDHYRDSTEKRNAAEFLIRNMPAHFSYSTDAVHRYYDFAEKILSSDLTPQKQYDTLLWYRDSVQPSLGGRICDNRIIKSGYLIHNIDMAFKVWKDNTWASHLSFDEFCEWILPYKIEDFQELDYWRDTLMTYFSEDIGSIGRDDVEYGTCFRTLDAVRNEILREIKPFGVYNRSPYPLMAAKLLPHQTFGRCSDYVNLGVLTYRSLGLPAIIDEAPFWGRYRAGHEWYVILGDRGQELPAEWDLGSVPGWQFFPYERIPKVFRHTYAVNPEIQKYLRKSVYRYPFNPCRSDVTDKYLKTCNINVKIKNFGKPGHKVRLPERYAYIAVFNGRATDWSIFDFGNVRNGYAHFRRLGRNILYIVLGYDGKGLIPISDPFILENDGSIRYIQSDTANPHSIDIRRKYYQSANVVTMRQRILGARIQYADSADFSDSVTVLSVNSTDIPDKIPLPAEIGPHRFWRYLAADGTYGSIAELAFLNGDSIIIKGEPLACRQVTENVAELAFDNDWLTNFETNEDDSSDGIWVGMDMGVPIEVSFIRIVPRSDDNDIHPGDEYELKWWNSTNGQWVTEAVRTATDNVLHYDNIPSGTLLWLHDRTRGWDERAFLIDNGGTIEWR